MKLLDENELAELANDIETCKALGEDDKDFLKGLEKMAQEVEDDAANPQ